MPMIASTAFETRTTDTLPLCVDLDGTLVRTDTLHELCLGALWSGREALRLPASLLKGRAAFKEAVSRCTVLRPDLLPYNEQLVGWLRSERNRGRWLVLATAAHREVAEAVSVHLGLFDELVATSEGRNLKGAAKAEALCARFGAGGFVYAGDSRADLAVWRSAAAAVVVNATPGVARAVRDTVHVEREFSPAGDRWRALVRTLRVHQWSKNLLVFVPIVTAGALADWSAFAATALMFLAFSLTASAIYIVNDLTDLAADRAHRTKRNRPFASGALPVLHGVLLAPALAVAGIALGALVGAETTLLLYAATSLAYSTWLKTYPLVDIFTLGFLYTLRLYAGGEASGYDVSLWLLAFSSFFFLSLATMKRVSELVALQQAGKSAVARRDYTAADLPILLAFGVGAAFVASLVLMLYVQQQFGVQQVEHGDLLWAIVPLMLFWQCRMWLSTARGYMLDDPIVYAARDWVSRWVVVVLVALFTIDAIR